jgi:hypothetical protein
MGSLRRTLGPWTICLVLRTRHARAGEAAYGGGSLIKAFSVLAVFGTTAAVVLLAAGGPLLGQSVSFDIVRPPPGRLGFKNLWDITLHNPTPDTWFVYFSVEASDDKVGPVFVATTREMPLPPGDRPLAASDIKLTDVWFYQGYAAFAEPGSSLPDGDYTYDITLVPEMTKTSFRLRVCAPKPVELTWPPNDAVVGDSEPVFVWKRPVVAGYYGEFRYGLRVVELARGQIGATAFSRNQPVLDDTRVSATMCRLPAGTVRLVAGRTYVWRIEARDTTGASVDTESPVGRFVYKPGAREAETHTTFMYPGTGQSVLGNTSLVVKSDIPGAELCVLEYSLGTDSIPRAWGMVGCFSEARDHFVGTWASDSAVIRAGKTFASPCVLRATVLGRKGQYGEALLRTMIDRPPARTRRGCGCGKK